MKKIVAAAAAGLLLAGAAFADVSFSWTGTGIVGGTSKSWHDVDRTDCLSLELSNDVAGVVLDFDIVEDQTVGTKNTNLELDQYYAWMTFGLPVGNLQVTSGKWTSRYVDRVKVDAGDLDAEYYESYKPGVIGGYIASDSDNLTGNAMSTIAAYTLADTLPGTLLVKAGMVSLQSNTYKADGDGIKIDKTTYNDYGRFDSKSGFAAEVAYRQEDVVNVNLAWRSLNSDSFSIGAFVSPLMIDNLNATVGFSFGSYDDDTTDGTEFGFDARARYAFTEKTAVTGMFNYSTIAKELAGSDDDLKEMWAMVSVNHVAGDNIRFLATLQNTVRDFDASHGNNLTAFTPACEITISENAVFTGAFDIRWDNKTPYAGIGDVSIPLYVTFSL